MPSHVDASILYVPIMPETSKMDAAMEKVGQEATESFGKGSAGLGDKIHESVSKTKDKLKDVFHRSGSDAADSIADGVKQNSKKVEDAIGDAGDKATSRFRETAKGLGKQLVDAIGPDTQKLLGDKLEETVGGALEGVLGNNSKLGGQFAHSVFDWGLDELKNKLGTVKDAADTTKKAFADFSSGNVAGGVSKLVENFDKLGVDVKDLPEPLQNVVNETGDAVGKFDEIKASVHEFADVFTGLPGKIGAVGAAIEALAGPLAVALAAAKDIDDEMRKSGLDPNAKGQARDNQFSDVFSRIHRDSNGNIVVDPKAPKPPGVDMNGVTGIDAKGGDVLGSSQDGYDAFSGGQPLPAAAPSGHASSSSPQRSWFNSSPRNVGSDKGLTPTSKSVKQVVASMFPQITDIGGWRPPDGYNEHSSGQALDVMIPNANTPQGKALGDQISNYVLAHAKELGVDYTIWQHGQHNPNGSFEYYPDRGSPTANHMDHVHIHTTRGGGGDLDDLPAPQAIDSIPGGEKSPAGRQHDPLYVTQVDASGNPPAKSDTENQAQQFGSGFLDGITQSLGLDGSVFKTFGGSSNPLDFGVTKMATNLLNHFAGGGARGGDGAANPTIPGLGNLIPGMAVSSAVASTPQGESPTRGSEGYTQVVNGDVHYGQWNVSGVPDPASLKPMQNAQQGNPGAAPQRYQSQMSGPAFGN